MAAGGLVYRLVWRPQTLRLQQKSLHVPPRQQPSSASSSPPSSSPNFTFHNGRQRRHQHTSSGKEDKSSRNVSSSSSGSLPPPSETIKSLPAPAVPQDDPIPVANNVPSLPLWQKLGPLTWAADSYARYQRKRPYWTQLISGMCLSIVADLAVQHMNRDREPITPIRTLRAITVGGISAIPTYRWVLYLSTNFNYASRTLSLFTKVAINQLVYTPVFNSYFFCMHALLAGETFSEAVRRVIRTVPISFTNSVKVWPAVTAFSFTFVPMEYRSVFSGVIAVGWQTYLVYLNRRDENTIVDARKAAALERGLAPSTPAIAVADTAAPAIAAPVIAAPAMATTAPAAATATATADRSTPVATTLASTVATAAVQESSESPNKQ